MREHISVKDCEDTQRVGRRLRRDSGGVLCRTGEAVWTPIFCSDSRLETLFSEGVIHTVAPYNSDPDRDSALQSCYYNSLSLASDIAHPRAPHVVTALLGTGVKEVSLETSTVALTKALLSLKKLQPEWEGHLELVLQPGPATESELAGVCRRLDSLGITN